jgi:hypothetical protein
MQGVNVLINNFSDVGGFLAISADFWRFWRIFWRRKIGVFVLNNIWPNSTKIKQNLSQNRQYFAYSFVESI